MNDFRAILDSVRRAPAGRVKVAIADVDGVLRGKYISRDKFLGLATPKGSGGFGFCDVVFGWDVNDQCYDNAKLTGWHRGFPDAQVRLDLANQPSVQSPPKCRAEPATLSS